MLLVSPGNQMISISGHCSYANSASDDSLSGQPIIGKSQKSDDLDFRDCAYANFASDDSPSGQPIIGKSWKLDDLDFRALRIC
jgi:hypothetical protein